MPSEPFYSTQRSAGARKKPRRAPRSHPGRPRAATDFHDEEDQPPLVAEQYSLPTRRFYAWLFAFVLLTAAYGWALGTILD